MKHSCYVEISKGGEASIDKQQNLDNFMQLFEGNISKVRKLEEVILNFMDCLTECQNGIIKDCREHIGTLDLLLNNTYKDNDQEPLTARFYRRINYKINSRLTTAISLLGLQKNNVSEDDYKKYFVPWSEKLFQFCSESQNERIAFYKTLNAKPPLPNTRASIAEQLIITQKLISLLETALEDIRGFLAKEVARKQLNP